MSVDDVGRREGAVLRNTFDRLTPPSNAHAVPPRRSVRIGMFIGVGAVLGIVLIVAMFGSLRGSEPAAKRGGGSWQRIEWRHAFGPGAYVFSITRWNDGFLALGRQPVVGHPTDTRPAVWTSSDGLHWSTKPGLRFPGGRFPGFGGVTVRRGVLITWTDGSELWRSTDATTWRRVARLPRSSRTGAIVTIGPHGFVAIGETLVFWNSPVWTSSDGREWKAVEQTGTETHPIGLYPETRLGSRWLSVGPSINNQPPNVYSSTDGVHWAPIPATNVPNHFGSPLAANHRHTQVLGIEYEHPATFGGKIWSSSDATTWKQIISFHHQMPAANPDDLVQNGPWWVLGGNTGTPDGMRRASMWTSHDLRYWYEMPQHLRGPKSQGTGVPLTASAGRVVGLGTGEHALQLWVWTPPA